MPQLLIVVGILAVANYAIFQSGIDFYEENMVDEKEGTVEVYEVETEEGAAAEDATQAQSAEEAAKTDVEEAQQAQ